jgi:hypothetical protein
MIDRMIRLLRAVAAGFVVLVVTAAPAAADAAKPTDFRSEVTGITGASDGVEARVRGGDSFLEVTVTGDHTVIVEGYLGEPYLRFQPDGTVEQNRLSTATYLNQDRRGKGVTIPQEAQDADEGTPPDWQPIAASGTYAWHDHRTHWMSDASPSVSRGEQVPGAYDPWRVPIVVDGAPGEIQGTLTYERAISPLPYLAIVVLGAALVVLWLRGSLRRPALVLVGVSALAVMTGRAEFQATPEGGGNPLLWALAAVALAAAIGALVLGDRPVGVVLALASVAALFGWGLFRVQVLLKPVLPTDLPYLLDRATVALALGTSLAAAFLTVTSGTLKLPALEED